MSQKPKSGAEQRPFLDIRIGALRITLENRPSRLIAAMATLTLGFGSWLVAGGTELLTR
ncbi:hypothetical protein ACFYNY_23885 [Streptomyces sp. NPDC006530]|uniref:hypothetical protein n=1 Tax=Streptomyces sp. NPDC006530 TaxID=3364750 RepID=UPI0036908114